MMYRFALFFVTLIVENQKVIIAPFKFKKKSKKLQIYGVLFAWNLLKYCITAS